MLTLPTEYLVKLHNGCGRPQLSTTLSYRFIKGTAGPNAHKTRAAERATTYPLFFLLPVLLQYTALPTSPRQVLAAVGSKNKQKPIKSKTYYS